MPKYMLKDGLTILQNMDLVTYYQMAVAEYFLMIFQK